MMDSQNPRNPMACPVCGAAMACVGDAAYYDLSSRYRTPVYDCAACDVLCRDVDAPRMESHYYAASYVQSRNEENLRQGREGFFRWVLSLVRGIGITGKAEPARRPVLLDFGSAYGHLLSLAQEEGFRAVGVELNERLVDACTAKGLVVYRSLEELAEQADVITALDSLYCVANPRELMAGLRSRLKPGGVLLARITNRNLHARLRERLGRKGDWSAIGDATVSYSVRGITKLLTSAGFRIAAIIPDRGRGKKLGIRRRLAYELSYLLTLGILKKCILTPGVVVIARAQEHPCSATP